MNVIFNRTGIIRELPDSQAQVLIDCGYAKQTKQNVVMREQETWAGYGKAIQEIGRQQPRSLAQRLIAKWYWLLILLPIALAGIFLR